jgi:hypothetical protein
MPRKIRNYEKEKKYDLKPKVVERRNARKRARRAYEKEHGDLPANVHVDHKNLLSKGGQATKMTNLRAIPAKQNVSFPRNKDGSAKSAYSTGAKAGRKAVGRGKK